MAAYSGLNRQYKKGKTLFCSELSSDFLDCFTNQKPGTDKRFFKEFSQKFAKKTSVHVVVDYPDTMSAWLLTTQTHAELVVDYVDMCQRSH